MREVDYLWDKSGGDAEIESLEAALQKFAYAERALPITTARPRFSWLNFFRFRFALAGGLVAVLVLGWLAISRSDPKSEIAFIDRTADEPTSKADFSGNTANYNALKNDERRPEVIHFSHCAGPKKKKRSVRTVVRPSRPLPQVMTAVAVTREEADAYNKLMLALSITSSKLKIVKDKIGDIDPATDR